MPVAATRAFIHCRARKRLGTRSTMPGLVHGGGDRGARPWGAGARRSPGSGPARPDPWNVSSWGDPALPQEADFVRERGQSTDEVGLLCSGGRALWCPRNVDGPRAAVLSTRVCPSHQPPPAGDISSDYGDILEGKPRLAEQEWRRCLTACHMAPVYDPPKKDVYLQRCTDVHLVPDCSGLHTQNTVVSRENIKRETMERKKRKAQASSDPWKEDWNLPLQSDTTLAVLEAQCLKDNGLMEQSQTGGRTAERYLQDDGVQE